jgi:hypothetical protein
MGLLNYKTKMGLLNYKTKIDPDKTASEIARCLSMHGAQAVLTEYDPPGGYVSALSFKITVNGQSMGFRLPCDRRPVMEILTRGKRKPPRYDERRFAAWEAQNRDQGVRTAWRIVKDWVEAQMASVETQMVSTQDVFLLYAVMTDGRTFADRVRESSQFLLGN